MHRALATRKLLAPSSGWWHRVQLSRGPGLPELDARPFRGVPTRGIQAAKEDNGKSSKHVLEPRRIRWAQVFSFGSEDAARCPAASSVSSRVQGGGLEFTLRSSRVFTHAFIQVCVRVVHGVSSTEETRW